MRLSPTHEQPESPQALIRLTLPHLVRQALVLILVLVLLELDFALDDLQKLVVIK